MSLPIWLHNGVESISYFSWLFLLCKQSRTICHVKHLLICTSFDNKVHLSLPFKEPEQSPQSHTYDEYIVFFLPGTPFTNTHDDGIKWEHFPRYWPFVRGIHRSPVNSPHKGQWRGALMFSFNCVWINGWVNDREAGDLRRYRAHYDVILMNLTLIPGWINIHISSKVWQDIICSFPNFKVCTIEVREWIYNFTYPSWDWI